jgi:polyisoprenoid-binding protein YceI
VEVQSCLRFILRPVTRRLALWLVLLPLLSLQAGAASGYHLDAGNTRLSFAVNRFGLRWMSAQFRELGGEFVLDRSGRGGRLDVAVLTASIECADAYWSERLRSPEWLDTAQFPVMLYRSTRIDFEGGTRAKVYGDLTLHGVTRPVTLTVTDIHCAESEGGGGPCSFAAQAQLKRSEFRLPHGFWQGGDAVEIFVRGS